MLNSKPGSRQPPKFSQSCQNTLRGKSRSLKVENIRSTFSEFRCQAMVVIVMVSCDGHWVGQSRWSLWWSA